MENQRGLQELCEAIPSVALQCVITAEAGFEVACSVQPNLIVFDVDLPDMHGWHLARMLKSNPLTSEIPIVAISTSYSIQDEQCAEALGVLGVYSKPFNFAELSECIQQILLRREGV